MLTKFLQLEASNSFVIHRQADIHHETSDGRNSISALWSDYPELLTATNQETVD